MINTSNLKSLLGQRVTLTSTYGSTYNSTLTEFDNDFITIKNQGFLEIVFAIEEVQNIELRA